MTRSVSAAIDAVKLGEIQFLELKADTNRLFILENTQLQEQNNLAIAHGNIALNLINVYRALGGGWEIRLQDTELGAASMAGPPEPTEAPFVPAPGQ